VATSDTDAPRTASRWEDYIDVFFSPRELYARRAHDSAKWPFWTLLLLSALAYYAFLPINQMVMRAAMVEQAQLGGADPAEVEAAAGGMLRVMSLAGGVMSALTFAITIAFAALLLWGIGRLVEVKGTYRQAFLIATYAAFVYLLMQIAGSVAALIAGEGLSPTRDLSFGLLRFLDPESLPRTVIALLRRTEIFFLWQAVLWAIGMKVIMKASSAQAAITAAGTWLLFAIPGVVGAMLQSGTPSAAG
jgi:hypothetical protein